LVGKCSKYISVSGPSGLATDSSMVVVAHSRELAHLQAYSAVLSSHGRLLALELPHGSFIPKYFTAMTYNQYQVSPQIDYKALRELAGAYRPRIISASAPSSGKLIDYKAIRSISHSIDAYLIADITEISGLVAAGCIPSPFEHSDIVITGTQGSLRGPCGALLFSRKAVQVQRAVQNGKEEVWNLDKAINASVFPRHQGGPHNHAIMAVAVAMEQIQTRCVKEYQELVLANAAVLASQLLGLGYNVLGNGTQSHQLAVKLNDVDPAFAKEVLDRVGVAIELVTLTGELHLGALAMTSRGLLPADFRRMAEIIHRGLTITKYLAMTIDAQMTADDSKASSTVRLGAFQKAIRRGVCGSEILKLRREVEGWMDTCSVPWEEGT
jgi:glycine hydroxymethyltransferase